MSTSLPLPSLFLSHGSPMTALEPREAGAFWGRLGPRLREAFGTPRAVLVLSAHTLARVPTLLAAPRHAAVHDFGGFDAALFQMRYDAPGAPQLAADVARRLAAAGLPVQQIDRGGLDHGIWVPLRFVFPQADVPVLPLAFSPHASPAELMALGQALAPLRQEGVLILGSGSLTHNLGWVFQPGPGGRPPSVDAAERPECRAFRDWVHRHAADGDVDALRDWAARAPHARDMHPTAEHWLPWYPALGAGGPHGVRLHDSVTFGCLAMDAYAFGDGAAVLRD
ncbi:MAG: dioxygenase [Rubrivivax sp.]|jgi:4,5-DOPA dioxygenase extradiol